MEVMVAKHKLTIVLLDFWMWERAFMIRLGTPLLDTTKSSFPFLYLSNVHIYPAWQSVTWWENQWLMELALVYHDDDVNEPREDADSLNEIKNNDRFCMTFCFMKECISASDEEMKDAITARTNTHQIKWNTWNRI